MDRLSFQKGVLKHSYSRDHNHQIGGIVHNENCLFKMWSKLVFQCRKPQNPTAECEIKIFILWHIFSSTPLVFKVLACSNFLTKIILWKRNWRTFLRYQTFPTRWDSPLQQNFYCVAVVLVAQFSSFPSTVCLANKFVCNMCYESYPLLARAAQELSASILQNLSVQLIRNTLYVGAHSVLFSFFPRLSATSARPTVGRSGATAVSSRPPSQPPPLRGMMMEFTLT